MQGLCSAGAGGLGYQERLAWTREGAEEEFAARENPLP